MKKLVTLVAALCLVAGCSSSSSLYSSKVENSNSAAVTGADVNITYQDLYEQLMESNGVNYVLNTALSKAAENFDIDEEALNEQVNSTVETYKSFIGEDLDAYTKQNLGYETFEEYKDAVIVPSVRQNIMVRNYSEENFDTLAQQYNFKKLSIITVADQSTALSIINDLNSEAITFEDAVTQYSTDTKTKNNNGNLGVVSDLSSTSTVDSNIINILPQFTVNALYTVPVQLSSGSYAVIDVVETDVNNMHDDIVSALQSSEEITIEAEAYYLKQVNFQVFDDRLKANIDALSPNYLK